MPPLLEQLIGALAIAIDTCGVAIVVFAVLKTLIAYVKIYFRTWELETPSSLRVALARALTFGLDLSRGRYSQDCGFTHPRTTRDLGGDHPLAHRAELFH